MRHLIRDILRCGMPQLGLDRRTFVMGALSTAAAARAAQPESQRKVRYGIVGAGNRSRGVHLPILRGYMPEVEITAICDITPENLQHAIEFCPGAKGYSDYRRMLAEQQNLDAVLVVVPNFLYAEIAVAALAAGKHVYVEKPMALSLADADRMMQAAKQKDRALQVGQQFRYSEAHARMRELIDQGAIGDVSYVFASLFRGDWNPRSWKYTDPATGKSTNWRMLTNTAGSSLLEDGIHELDVIHWVVNSDPVRIQAQGGNKVLRDRETIDNAGLLVEFANGARLVFGYTVFTPRLPSARVLRVMGLKAEITVEGTRTQAEVVIRPFEGAETRIPVASERPVLTATSWDWRGSPDPHTYRAHRAFLRSVQSGAPVFADGKVGRDAIHISLAAERSLRTGQTFRWEDEAEL